MIYNIVTAQTQPQHEWELSFLLIAYRLCSFYFLAYVYSVYNRQLSKVSIVIWAGEPCVKAIMMQAHMS